MSAAADIIAVSRRAASRSSAQRPSSACASLLACVAPFGLNGYGLYLLTLTEIFVLVALGLNLLTGYAGQISLCHAAFFGVGAYATAILTQKAGVPYLVVAVAGRAVHDRDRRVGGDARAAAEEPLSRDCDARFRRRAAEDHLRVARPDRRRRRPRADARRASPDTNWVRPDFIT